MASHEVIKENLNGKVAIVTGAGRGIGRGIAEVLASRGAKVVVTSRTEAEIIETAMLIHNQGGIALPIPADVTNEKDVIRLITTTVKEFGSIDILVNNSGSFQSIDPIWKADPETWWKDVTTNLKGVFLCSHHAVPVMINQGSGVIINLSGGGGTAYLLYGSGYASSKAAVLRFTEQLSRELKDQGHDDIVAYAVNPGLVVTKTTKFQAETQKGQKYIPSTKECFEKGMVRQPQECGHLCAWLAEKQPKEFSGRLFTVNDDLDQLWLERQKIVEQDLRLLREKK